MSLTSVAEAGIEPAIRSAYEAVGDTNTLPAIVDPTIIARSRFAVKSALGDLNPRPSAPKADALPDCAKRRLSIELVYRFY